MINSTKMNKSTQVLKKKILSASQHLKEVQNLIYHSQLLELIVDESYILGNYREHKFDAGCSCYMK